MITSPLARAQLLYHQSRFDLAEVEVRRVLGETPHDAGAHALLALCLVEQEKFDEAEEEVGQAIVLAPDWAYPHYCRSIVLEHRKQFAQAETAAREAIALEPFDPDYHARLAATLFHQGQWQAALDAAVEGLSYDAEHAQCGHLRTMALTKLGRQSEAVASVDEALGRIPDDAFSHANKGWALLHQSQPRDALEHFREALRISPTMEYAQQGIVESLKARNPLYRWILAYFLWMARLSNGARWGVILGGYILMRALSGAGRANPNLAVWTTPILILYFVFVLLTWFAYPLFNLLLRFNKFGWYALNRDQRAASNWFGACLALVVAGVVAELVFEIPLGILVAGFAIGMALPLVTIHSCDKGWPRQMMSLFTAAMAAVGVAAIGGTALGMATASSLISVFLLGFIATPWIANALVSAQATR
jgi:tetratricopeptide (TPR) repeat protein